MHFNTGSSTIENGFERWIYKWSHQRDSNFRKIIGFAHLEVFGQENHQTSRPSGVRTLVYPFSFSILDVLRKDGATRGIRTPDLLITSQPLNRAKLWWQFLRGKYAFIIKYLGTRNIRLARSSRREQKDSWGGSGLGT